LAAFSIKLFWKAVIGFIVLDLYFAIVTTQLGNPFLQFAGTLAFFPLAYFIANWVGLDGLKGIGLFIHPGWKKNFFYSILIGFSFWMLWYGIEFQTGQLELVGIKQPSELFMPLIEVFVGFFVGSLINDVIVRGYVMNLLKGKIHLIWIITISILLYAFDDYWYAGLSIHNVVFSIILGLSLTFAVYKTGSIWADTGIHYGLNIAYGLFYGLVGKAGGGIFIIKETGKDSTLSSLLPFIIPGIMFIFVLWVLKFYSHTKKSNMDVPFSA
jgi:membrane protease YdiL (CAAX protease family)